MSAVTTSYSSRFLTFPRISPKAKQNGAALYLASNDSAFVSGASLAIDGGRTARE